MAPNGPRKGGRPIQDTRMVLEGILGVLKSGARWRDLPHPPYLAYQTCDRYFQRWVSCGAFEKIVELLVRDAESVGWRRLRGSYRRLRMRWEVK